MFTVGNLYVGQFLVDTEVAPPVPSTEDQHSDVSQQQRQVEDPRDKNLLRQKPEVDRPLVEEDSAEVEGSDEVLGGSVPEEGGGQQDLQPGTDGELDQGPHLAQVGQVEDEDGGGVEEDVHLDRDRQAEHEAAQAVALVHEQVEGGVEEQDGQRIIEQSEDEDGMYSVAGEAHQDQDVGRNLLCPHQNPEDQAEVQNVEECEYILQHSLRHIYS